MCGIFAAINLKDSFSEKDHAEFAQATQLVSYRGPDCTGTIQFKDSGQQANPNHFTIFLGHNRLSIVDLSSHGNQPMLSDDIALVFNGEIFNYIELREELKNLGHIFKTQTDTEVIIKTYLQFGEKGFNRFNGMWALVLYDKNKNRVIVSRDRFSIKPLYYLKHNHAIFFASEIKQLLHLKKGHKINEQKILTFLQQSLLDYNTQTFYTNIQQVPAKYNWTINLKTATIEESCYWNYSLKIQNINENEAVEQFTYLFDQSIKLRLRGDVKVGSLLSGGLDSSSITLAATAHNPDFHSFSAVFDHHRYSEKKHINAFSSQSGIPNTSFQFSADEVIRNLDKTIYHQEEPLVSFSVIGQYLLFERIKKESDVVCLLCGQGADEILMGYLKYYYFSLKQNAKSFRLDQFAGNFFGSLYHRTALANFNFSHAKRYMPFLRGKKQNYLRKFAQTEKIWSSGNLNTRQTLDVDHYSVPILNRYEDRNSMAHSLEVRLPFLDHELVDFCINLPYSLKIKNGWTKYIMRKSMDKLPPDIRWRRDKEGFVSPEVVWMKKEFRDLISTRFKNSRLHEMGILNANVLITEFDKFADGKKTSVTYEEFLKVFMTEKWLESAHNNFHVHEV